jgi:hypothetical protein
MDGDVVKFDVVQNQVAVVSDDGIIRFPDA